MIVISSIISGRGVFSRNFPPFLPPSSGFTLPSPQIHLRESDVVTSASSLPSFKRQLKTFLFRTHFLSFSSILIVYRVLETFSLNATLIYTFNNNNQGSAIISSQRVNDIIICSDQTRSMCSKYTRNAFAVENVFFMYLEPRKRVWSI